MKKFSRGVLCSFILILCTQLLHAQVSAGQALVKISGAVSAPFNLDYQNAGQFNHVTVIRNDRDGKPHSYSGITISDLLQKAGVTVGKEMDEGKEVKGGNLVKMVLAEAGDGYKAAFAFAELDKDFTDKLVIVADAMDGKPLPAADGLFRIIIQDEKKAGRCIKNLTSLKILVAK